MGPKMTSRPPNETSFRQNQCARLGGSLTQEPPPPKKNIAESLCAEGREITHAQKRNP